MFTKESDYKYEDGDNRATRYKENGLASRIEDIIKDYVRTSRDTNGRKGILIEKVGVKDDASYYSNYFTDKIGDMDDRIDSMIDFLADKENSYYMMFARMESALSQMESQYNSLLSSIGG